MTEFEIKLRNRMSQESDLTVNLSSVNPKFENLISCNQPKFHTQLPLFLLKII